MTTKPAVAFIGLGTMGAGMALRLAEAGFPLRLFNRNPDRYRPFDGSTAHPCKTPAEAARGAEVVISMVSDDEVSKTIWQGPDGALSAAGRGAILIESSTLSLGWVRELSNLSKARGCHFLDAPVAGSKDQANSGKLKFMVGGPADVINKVTPVLSAMSCEIVPLGPVGSGTVLKLVNNFVCGAEVAALAEGVAILERFNMDRSAALRMLTNGAAGSPLIQTMASRVEKNDFTPNFSVSLIRKDLSYAIDEARKIGLDLLCGEAARERFQQAEGAGLGAKDIASLVDFIRKTIDPGVERLH